MPPSKPIQSKPSSQLSDCCCDQRNGQRDATSGHERRCVLFSPPLNTTNTKRIGCQTLCEITSDFSSLALTSFKLKNRHWWNAGQKYHRINYVIKVSLGPADIRFELWHNGQKLNKDNTIKVEWHAAQAPPEPPLKNGFYPSSQQWQPDASSGVVNGLA
jgi:hypothetical protein